MVARAWWRCQRKSQRTPERMITGGLDKGSPPRPTHQGVRAGRIGHRPLAVDAVEPEEPENLDGPLYLAIRHGAPPRVHRRDLWVAAQGRGALQGAVGAPVEALAEKGEEAPKLLVGVREEVLVEGEVYLPRSELPQGCVVLDAPEKRWRSKPPREPRISASMGSKKSSTSSSCSIVSERTSRHPRARLEPTTAQGWRRSKTMGMPGKFSRIQPSSRLAPMSLIRRRLATNFLLNRSVQRLLSSPVSTVLAGPRYSARLSSGLRYCLRRKFRSIWTLPGWKGSKTKR